ncbi:MAG: urea transport system permease protein [Acidimicrobiaceae bacterium]
MRTSLLDSRVPSIGQSRREAIGRRVVFAVVAALVLVAPLLLSDFRLNLLAKYLCFAILAVGIDLAWGYGGMLTLGQGAFFGLGGYAMAMHLKLAEVGAGQVPDFMSWSGVERLPLLWKPFAYPWFAIPAAVLIPMGVAALLGSLVFRRRVRGAYFAILTQALAAAFVILLIGQQGLTGGTNGLTNVHTLFGYDLNDPANRRLLYVITAVALGVVFLLTRQLVHSRFGRLLMAVRDGEGRVRFLGYNPTTVKVVAFSLAAGMGGLAGALFVPVVGIISPAMLGVVASLEMVIWVAVGGRGTLVGAVVGAVLVNYAHTTLSERIPAGWLYVQGALFIVVIAFAPGGLASLREVPGKLRRRAPQPAPGGAAELEAA